MKLLVVPVSFCFTAYSFFFYWIMTFIRVRTLTFISMLLTNNKNIMWVSQILGHKTANITFEKYDRFIKEDVKNRAKFIQKCHIFGTQDNPTRLKAQK